MEPRIGRNTNTYGSVTAPLEILLNDTTYTELSPENLKRLGYKITQVKKAIIVKEMGAAVPDSQDRGFEIRAKESYESKTDNIPVGVISAKSVSGNTTILFVEE